MSDHYRTRRSKWFLPAADAAIRELQTEMMHRHDEDRPKPPTFTKRSSPRVLRGAPTTHTPFPYSQHKKRKYKVTLAPVSIKAVED